MLSFMYVMLEGRPVVFTVETEEEGSEVKEGRGDEEDGQSMGVEELKTGGCEAHPSFFRYSIRFLLFRRPTRATRCCDLCVLVGAALCLLH